ncbi:S-adenosyl-L-methionine-dependent methyltransferase [Pisolithus orientalis]|uniref:S-adenosyl-L-methionine-dependent methyltransferase n=1 Tax=Pisolithus orientalis TaxID=936130 RepID=UPI002223F986|nr:S-adenosyl-L-methionine-dependent methyltransferase [Pisolithus orientalis]KAI5999408.1 S-adenosyl-L-methionine-dependent methyltransferase [Pisolithus orientalis]
MLRASLGQAGRHCWRRQNLKAYFSSSLPWWSDSPPRRSNHDKDKINYNPNISFSADVSDEHLSYPRVTANELASIGDNAPPTRVRMLVRNFIEDALYNPYYGYFSKQATILTAPGEENEGFDFNEFKDSAHFESAVASRYTECGNVTETEGPGRQIWHTPTELFKPWYGQAIAQCLVSEYLLKYFPYEDFKIYELGAGNGTLALNILDYLRVQFPEVYDRTLYTIIEISAPLARIQRERLRRAGHTKRTVNVHHRSIFSWTKTERAPCYVLATEVVDNFAHDVVRYDVRTLEPFQGEVAVDDAGEFIPYYTRITDPLISSFLSLRRRLRHQPTLPWYLRSSALRRIYASLPFAPNLSPPEYIPTRMLSFLRVLQLYFPLHRLLLTDFSSLPDAISGANAPVVQTSIRGTMVPCQTLFVRQGYFDILFPTAFEPLRDMYEYILEQPAGIVADADDLDHSRMSPLASSSSPLSLGMQFFSPSNRRPPHDGISSASGLAVGERKSSVYSHAEFMGTYADLGKTQLRNGENPMLDFYKNVQVLF